MDVDYVGMDAIMSVCGRDYVGVDVDYSVLNCLFRHDFAFLDCHRKPFAGATAQIEALDASGQKVLHQRLSIDTHIVRRHPRAICASLTACLRLYEWV